MKTKRIWNQCKKKNRYRDEHTVNFYRKKLSSQNGIDLDYYWCAYCNGYHLTSETFRPDGYGLQVEGDSITYIPKEDEEILARKMFYLGRKNRIKVSIEEFEALAAAN